MAYVTLTFRKKRWKRLDLLFGFPVPVYTAMTWPRTFILGQDGGRHGATAVIACWPTLAYVCHCDAHLNNVLRPDSAYTAVVRLTTTAAFLVVCRQCSRLSACTLVLFVCACMYEGVSAYRSMFYIIILCMCMCSDYINWIECRTRRVSCKATSCRTNTSPRKDSSHLVMLRLLLLGLQRASSDHTTDRWWNKARTCLLHHRTSTAL